MFVCGKELANAYTELNDPVKQAELFRAEKNNYDNENNNDDFVLSLEYGLPPTAGFGMGIDRLVMLLTGQNSIREVLLFPTMKPKLKCETSKSQ